MREIFLENSVTRHDLREPEQSVPIDRRKFLRTIAVVGVGLTVAPKNLFAQDGDVGRWRDRVTGFVSCVCDRRRANSINYQLNQAVIYRAPRARDFHTYYSAPLIFFETMISPEEVICGNRFEVNLFPYYDARCPCRGTNDLNACEIETVTNKAEIERFGCVLTPDGWREPEYGDHADYYRTVSKYGADPNRITPNYKRRFAGKGRVRYGYHVTDNTRVGENGKPFRDIFLSSADI